MNKTRKMILAVSAILLTATLVSATLLPFFGQVTTTATVEQAVVISANGITWNNYDTPITYTIPEAAPGGETFCYEQWIWNKASIPVAVSLDTNVYAGITTTYSIPTIYSYNHTILGVAITVEDTGDGWLQWTYTGNDTTREVPKMTVAIDYPTGFAITTFDDGTHNGWYYAPDPDIEGSRVRIGDYSGASWDWVQAAASGHVMIVKILKSHLSDNCDSFKWHGYANFYNAQCWINGNETGVDYHIPQFVVNLWGAPLTAPFTLLSQQKLQFRICYAFALNIGPGTYILTTTVNAIEI